MSTATARSVTKATLSAFVREHTCLNLTQSKALTDSLLTEYSVTPKPPAGPQERSVPVDAGQVWVHEPSGRAVRVLDVELGPEYVAGDPVTSWGPQSVFWQDTSDSTAAGTTGIQLWRDHMTLLDDGESPTAIPTPEHERPA